MVNTPRKLLQRTDFCKKTHQFFCQRGLFSWIKFTASGEQHLKLSDRVKQLLTNQIVLIPSAINDMRAVTTEHPHLCILKNCTEVL